MDHLIVPIDGSQASWRAAHVAVALARHTESTIDVVEVVHDPKDVGTAKVRLADGIGELDALDIPVTPYVDVAIESVAASLAARLHDAPEATMVMASHGHGRSAAILGSVTEDLLAREYGPIVVVGPHVETTDMKFGGPLLITVDGSDYSELALGLGAAWAIELGITPWVIEVNAPDQVSSEHLVESSYPARLARELGERSGHTVEFEVLHGRHVAETMTDHAQSVDASMIVAATHGRTGMARLTIGSTAADMVHRATCPVVLMRPPNLQD